MPQPEPPTQRFQYRARDAEGAERKGVLDASSQAAAIRELVDKQWLPIEVLPTQAARPVGSGAGARMLRLGERIVLLSELATLLEAGVSVGEALPSMAEGYAQQPSGAALGRLRDAVNSGRPLAESLRQQPQLGLPPYVLALVEAGEAGGALARALREAAEQLEHDRRAAEDMRSALVYPSILVVVGTLVILAIFIGVVPRFANLLSNPRADVPDLSRWVITSAVQVRQHLWSYGLGALAVLAVLASSFSGSAGQRRLMALALWVPPLRHWLVEADLGRWATVLSTLLGNRVPIIRALQLSGAAIRQRGMGSDVQHLAGELERGRALADALRELTWFPVNRVNLVRVGERSGQLPRTLATLGAMHTEAARGRQRRLLSLIEPIAILLIGGVVGFVMVAVMSAITSVNSLTG